MSVLSALFNELLLIWLRAELGRAMEVGDLHSALTICKAMHAARKQRPAGWAGWLERARAVRP